MQRKGMKALLAFMDAHLDERFVVIFDDLKRLARDNRAHLDLRDAFRDRCAVIECLNFKFDDSLESEFLETIIAAQRALERKQNGRQVARKMEARVKSGFWIHNPPIGLRYTTDKGRGKVLIHNPPFHKIIVETFESFASGTLQTQAEVKRFFEGFPDFPRNKRGEVTQQRVADILSQPVYAGYICSETYGIHWLKAQHEPLVSLDTFDKVQERRKQASYAHQRKNFGNDFALCGVACCAGCDVQLRSSWVKGKSKYCTYYLCQTNSCSEYGKSIARDKIEGDIGELIRSLQPKPNLIKIVSAMFRVAWDQCRDQAQHILATGQLELKDMDRRIEKLLERIMQAQSERMIPI